MPTSGFERRFAELPHDRERVIAWHTGAREWKAAYFLKYQGDPRVSNMKGVFFK